MPCPTDPFFPKPWAGIPVWGPITTTTEGSPSQNFVGKTIQQLSWKTWAAEPGGRLQHPRDLGQGIIRRRKTSDVFRDASEFESEMPQILGASTFELLVEGFWTCNEITPPKYKRTNKNTNLQKSKVPTTKQTRQLPSAISKRVTGHPAIVVGAKEHLGAVMNFAAPEKRKRKHRSQNKRHNTGALGHLWKNQHINSPSPQRVDYDQALHNLPIFSQVPSCGK